MPFKKKREKEADEFEEIDIDDIESYRGEPDLKFSHEQLVMEQYRRTLKVGSEEMKKGFEERKYDRIGNVVSIKPYPDTRKQFGECVDTLKNLLIGSITGDEKAKDNVPAFYKAREVLLKRYIEMEEKAWQLIPAHLRSYGSKWLDRWEHIQGTLNFDHIYGEKYLQETVAVYRQILEEIGLLLHRMGYFKGIHV